MDEVEYRRRLKKPHRQLEIMPCDLPHNQLPTTGQVLGKVMKIRLEEMRDKNVEEKMISIKKCIRDVAVEIVGLWEKASVPAKRIDKVEECITKLWSRKEKLRKDKKK